MNCQEHRFTHYQYGSIARNLPPADCMRDAHVRRTLIWSPAVPTPHHSVTTGAPAGKSGWESSADREFCREALRLDKRGKAGSGT